jgi:hypothetical protein
MNFPRICQFQMSCFLDIGIFNEDKAMTISCFFFFLLMKLRGDPNVVMASISKLYSMTYEKSNLYKDTFIQLRHPFIYEKLMICQDFSDDWR